MNTLVSITTAIHNAMPSEGIVIAGLFGSIALVVIIDCITSVFPSKKAKV